MLISMEGRSGHEYLRWNSEVQHWFCIACGRTSDHQSLTDAKIEIEQFDCELPFVESMGAFHDPDRR